MPRPKPPLPLKIRQVRLDASQYAVFRHIGGAAWLRRTLGRMPLKMSVYNRLRNSEIKRHLAAGTSVTEVARKLGVSEATVYAFKKETL